MTFHLFFEQSGTFKNELRKLGYEAIDYDILNDFGQYANRFLRQYILPIQEMK